MCLFFLRSNLLLLLIRHWLLLCGLLHGPLILFPSLKCCNSPKLCVHLPDFFPYAIFSLSDLYTFVLKEHKPIVLNLGLYLISYRNSRLIPVIDSPSSHECPSDTSKFNFSKNIHLCTSLPQHAFLHTIRKKVYFFVCILILRNDASIHSWL